MKKKEKQISDKEVLKELPSTRKELFFDLLKYRKMNLFALSCYTFMFFIPLVIDLIYFNFLESMSIANEKYEYLFSFIFYSMLIMIPCICIGFVALGGAFYVSKKIVWQEGIALSNDFFTGLKENWKHSLINGFVFSLTLFGLIVGCSYLLIYQPLNNIVRGIGIGALILIFILFGMIIALNYTQSVYYKNSYIITLKNSFSFLGLLNWKIFVVFLLSTGVVITLSLFNLITLIIGLLLFAIFNSVVIILYTLIAHNAFDKYINKDHYPEMVNKGLYKKDREA